MEVLVLEVAEDRPAGSSDVVGYAVLEAEMGGFAPLGGHDPSTSQAVMEVLVMEVAGRSLALPQRPATAGAQYSVNVVSRTGLEFVMDDAAADDVADVAADDTEQGVTLVASKQAVPLDGSVHATRLWRIRATMKIQ